MSNEKHSDIVAEVRLENPAANNGELAKLVNERIRALEGRSDKPVLEPINTTVELSPQVKAHAENVAQRKNILIQFVRPKGRKIIGANVNFVSEDIKKIFARKAPVGALVAFRDGADIVVGWSKRHNTEEPAPFMKKDATLIAIMRGLTDGIKGNPIGFYETSSGRALPRAINKALDGFATRALAYFKKGEFKNLELI